MNLKEAFRYQNVLIDWLHQAQFALGRDDNVMVTTETYRYSRVKHDVPDETVQIDNNFEFADKVNDLVRFMLALFAERGRVTSAIMEAKKGLPINLDAEIGLNSVRQQIANTLRKMSTLRSKEAVIPNGAVGYTFDINGVQTAYKCDKQIVKTINFDRNYVTAQLKTLESYADLMSSEIDKAMVVTEIDFVPSFNLNDHFDVAFETWLLASGDQN